MRRLLFDVVPPTTTRSLAGRVVHARCTTRTSSQSRLSVVCTVCCVEASDRITSTAAAATARGSASLNMFHNSYFDCVDGKKTLYSSVYCAVYPFKLQVTEFLENAWQFYRPRVRPSACFYPILWIDFTFIFCMYMGHEHSSPGTESQDQRSMQTMRATRVIATSCHTQNWYYHQRCYTHHIVRQSSCSRNVTWYASQHAKFVIWTQPSPIHELTWIHVHLWTRPVLAADIVQDRAQS